MRFSFGLSCFDKALLGVGWAGVRNLINGLEGLIKHSLCPVMHLLLAFLTFPWSIFSLYLSVYLWELICILQAHFLFKENIKRSFVFLCRVGDRIGDGNGIYWGFRFPSPLTFPPQDGKSQKLWLEVNLLLSQCSTSRTFHSGQTLNGASGVMWKSWGKDGRTRENGTP